tara:strand:- start:59090 stop:59323 length:234 start_codon:yes stop_codon:yes gene_type:complete
MIRTEKNKLYTGIARDYERRFLEHLSGIGGAKFFRSDTPCELVYLEEWDNRSLASKREYEIKQLSRKAKDKLIQSIL